MKIYIPSDLNRESIDQLLIESLTPSLLPIDSVITYDFAFLRFIKPAGVTLLSNLFQWLLSKGVKVLVSNHNIDSEPIRYLDDSEFFSRYLGQKLNSRSRVRSTTLPLMLVKYEESFTWLEHRFTPWLLNSLNLKSRLPIEEIIISLQELFNNIKDHANENTGCIFAQHYPRIDQVIITISDFGVGIPTNVRKVIPSLSDSEALEHSIVQGFSSKSTPKNRGVGLDTLIQNVVISNKGTVHIQSNHGILECRNVSNTLHKTTFNRESFYPGTFIELVLDTRNIDYNIDEEVEFEW